MTLKSTPDSSKLVQQDWQIQVFEKGLNQCSSLPYGKDRQYRNTGFFLLLDLPMPFKLYIPSLLHRLFICICHESQRTDIQTAFILVRFKQLQPYGTDFNEAPPHFRPSSLIALFVCFCRKTLFSNIITNNIQVLMHF